MSGSLQLGWPSFTSGWSTSASEAVYIDPRKTYSSFGDRDTISVEELAITNQPLCERRGGDDAMAAVANAS